MLTIQVQEELLQRTFVYATSNGQKVCTEIIKKIHDADADNHQNIKFLCKVGDDGAEEIMSYTEICHLIEEQDLAEASSQFHTFKRVLDHHGPLKSQDAAYNKCLYNVKILWEIDTETWEPLNVKMKDDPITLVSYALEIELLDQPIWKKLRKYTKNNKKYQRLVKQSIMKGERRTPIFKFGVQVPRDHQEAIMLDDKNGDTKWQDAEKKELTQ